MPMRPQTPPERRGGRARPDPSPRRARLRGSTVACRPIRPARSSPAVDQLGLGEAAADPDAAGVDAAGEAGGDAAAEPGAAGGARGGGGARRGARVALGVRGALSPRPLLEWGDLGRAG